MYAANDWSVVEYGQPGRKFTVNELGPSVQAEIVEFSNRPKDHYGEPIQGEDDCFVIFKVGDRYFKKTGSESSYDEEIIWNGNVVEVFAEEKTVLTFRSKK